MSNLQRGADTFLSAIQDTAPVRNMTGWKTRSPVCQASKILIMADSPLLKPMENYTQIQLSGNPGQLPVMVKHIRRF